MGNHTFTTTLDEQEVTVECNLIAGEPMTRTDPGWPDECELELVTIDGEEIDIDDLTDDEQQELVDEAFRTALEEAQEYHGD